MERSYKGFNEQSDNWGYGPALKPGLRVTMKAWDKEIWSGFIAAWIQKKRLEERRNRDARQVLQPGISRGEL